MVKYRYAEELLGTKLVKAKKRQLTYAQKMELWDTTKHVCHICGGRISGIRDADFDHVRAHAKGGRTSFTNIKLAHTRCHRLKGTKTVSQVRKRMGIAIKSKRKKRTAVEKKVKPYNFADEYAKIQKKQQQEWKRLGLR